MSGNETRTGEWVRGPPKDSPQRTDKDSEHGLRRTHPGVTQTDGISFPLRLRVPLSHKGVGTFVYYHWEDRSGVYTRRGLQSLPSRQDDGCIPSSEPLWELRRERGRG